MAIGVTLAFAASVSHVIPDAQAIGSVQASHQAQPQEFTVGAVSAVVPVVRDGFGVTVKPPIQWPLPPGTPMASQFGPRSCSGCSSDHQGVDLNPGSGAPVQAMASGVVVESGSSGSFGVHVEISHLIDGEVVTSLYAHMQSGSMTLAPGDLVTVGQVLGLVGCTGNCTGAHLHFEIHPGGGDAVDPVAWLQARLQ